MEGEYSPTSPHAWALLSVLPKSAADMVLAPIGYTVTQQEGGACHGQVGSALGRAIATITEALEDGRIDHRERLILDAALRKLQDTVEIGRASGRERVGTEE